MAILYGNYSIALYFVKDHKMMVVKDAQHYRQLAQNRRIEYFVDYAKLLECLRKQLDDLSIPDLFDEANAGKYRGSVEAFKMMDPVIDPNETWGQMINRLLKCDPAPLVERRTLPSSLQDAGKGALLS